MCGSFWACDSSFPVGRRPHSLRLASPLDALFFWLAVQLGVQVEAALGGGFLFFYHDPMSAGEGILARAVTCQETGSSSWADPRMK